MRPFRNARVGSGGPFGRRARANKSGRVLSERGRLALITLLTAAVALIVAWAASDDPTPDPIPAASHRSL